jgi:predicted transcriptional regulator
MTQPFSLSLDAAAALLAEIDAALAEADAGAFVSSEAVTDWMETWGSRRETPPPDSDLPRG